MRSLDEVQALQRRAAEKSAETYRRPFVVFSEDLTLWRAQLANGYQPKLPFPVLNGEIVHGWEVSDIFPVTVDIQTLVLSLREGHAYAIGDSGETIEFSRIADEAMVALVA